MRFPRILATLALLLCGSASMQADYTYVFQGTDGSGIEMDREQLFSPFANFIVFSPDLEYCYLRGVPCGGALFVSSRPDATIGTHDFVSFSGAIADTARFADQALTRTGTSWTIPGSGLSGKLLVYDRDPDYLFEYFLKDTSGERTFRFYTDRLITREFKIADGITDLCSSAFTQGCETGDFIANVAGLDGLRLPGLLPFFFPQFAFSSLGIHYTDPFSPETGVLTVRSVRNPFSTGGPGGPGNPGGPLDPGVDAEPVPEPSTLALVGLGGCLALWVRRRRSVRG